MGSVLAIYFGRRALKEIRESNGAERGAGLARTGIVFGVIGVVVFGLMFILLLVDTVSS